MHLRTVTPSRFLLTAAGLSALAAATVYCSGGGSSAASGPEGGAPADATTASPDSGGTVGGGDGGSSEDATTPPGDAAAGSDGSLGSGGKPNVLFFLTDDLSWNLVPHMPNVQALQKKGITFSHYFVTESLCCPSRSSIFTGKYPHDTNVLANSGVQGGYAAFEDAGNATQTFATSLAAEGYHLKMMGKYLNGYFPGSKAGQDPAADPKDPGWTDWAVAGNGYPEYDYWLNQDGTSVYYGDAGADYLTGVLHKMAVAYAVPANAPFVLEVATFAPHAPYTPAPQDLGTYDAGLPPVPSFNAPNVNPPGWLQVHKPLDAAEIQHLNDSFDLRVEAVQAVDRMIGDLMSKLAASGLDKTTYVVFSSDNGYHMGEHTLGAGKQTAFDTDINVPLVVVGPGVPAGAVDDHVVENIDLCPTFAELGGAPPLATADGHSIVSLIHGQSVTDWRNVLLVEHKGGTMDPADPDNEQNVDGGPGSGPDPTTYDAIRMVGTGPDGGLTNKVFVSYVDGETEYYDIDQDPYERTNTAVNLAPATVTQYQATVSAIKACKGTATCWAAQHM
ncbi:MAG TPA: sulfatase [Polyangiaceae bacterium]|jgi:arylsulfatase A-like enzyme